MMVRVWIAPWLVVGMLIGGGWWLVASVFLAIVAVAHQQEWSVLRYASVTLATAVALPTIIILTGA